MSNSILLVDDEANVLTALSRALYEEPLVITTATGGDEALKIMATQVFKVVISDERMIGMQGSEFLSKVRNCYPDTIRIMLTGHATLEAAMKAVNEGEIYRFFAKPWNDHDLIFAIRAAVEKFDLEVENRALLETVKSQAINIRRLEKSYPGISVINRDQHGSVVLEELSEGEMAELFRECEERFGVRLPS
jgi:DNA-binding NtrC family response regulator